MMVDENAPRGRRLGWTTILVVLVPAVVLGLISYLYALTV